MRLHRATCCATGCYTLQVTVSAAPCPRRRGARVAADGAGAGALPGRCQHPRGCRVLLCHRSPSAPAVRAPACGAGDGRQRVRERRQRRCAARRPVAASCAALLRPLRLRCPARLSRSVADACRALSDAVRTAHRSRAQYGQPARHTNAWQRVERAQRESHRSRAAARR